MRSFTISHHFINTVCHSNILQPLKGHLQGVHLIHLNSKVNTMSHQGTSNSSGELAVQMYQVYPLKMTI